MLLDVIPKSKQTNAIKWPFKNDITTNCCILMSSTVHSSLEQGWLCSHNTQDLHSEDSQDRGLES